MLSSQFVNGERGIDPMPLDDDLQITVGLEVSLFERIHRLRKDGTTTEREYRTFVSGHVIEILPKIFRVRWSFSEGIGDIQSEVGGTGVYRRNKLFKR